MEEGQRKQGRVLVLVAIAIASSLLLIGALALFRPRAILSYEDGVAFLLDQQRVGYQQILISRAYPPSGIWDAYAFDVDVLLASGQRIPGVIECNPSRSACYLTLAKLRLRERMPKLEARWRPPWVAWGEAIARRLGFE